MTQIRKKKILIGCEFSGVVRRAMRARGHDAWSCDLLPAEDNSPHHIQGDLVKLLKQFRAGDWDLIILHPPCTALALSGNSTYGRGMPKHRERLKALRWTAALWKRAKEICPAVALENPMNVLGKKIGKRSQAIQPYEFGHKEQKETWLWLHGLPSLKPAKNVYTKMMKLPRKQRERLHYLSPGPNRCKERSRTFTGVADAMAEQWGNLH